MAITETSRETEAAQAARIPTRVLVIDDDPALRRSLERVLTQNNYEVVGAATAEDARNILDVQTFPVVLLDMVLPDAEGLELQREIKATQAETEILVVTAHGSIESAVEAMRWGAFDYLTKPFHTEELLTRLNKAVERIALERENRALRQQLSQQTVDRILVEPADC
jgi:DNA-binding NtrC family response regulator